MCLLYIIKDKELPKEILGFKVMEKTEKRYFRSCFHPNCFKLNQTIIDRSGKIEFWDVNLRHSDYLGGFHVFKEKYSANMLLKSPLIGGALAMGESLVICKVKLKQIQTIGYEDDSKNHLVYVGRELTILEVV